MPAAYDSRRNKPLAADARGARMGPLGESPHPLRTKSLRAYEAQIDADGTGRRNVRARWALPALAAPLPNVANRLSFALTESRYTQHHSTRRIDASQ